MRKLGIIVVAFLLGMAVMLVGPTLAHGPGADFPEHDGDTCEEMLQYCDEIADGDMSLECAATMGEVSHDCPSDSEMHEEGYHHDMMRGMMMGGMGMR